MSLRIALYGDVDLNLVDGSTIWLDSVVRLLHRAGDAEIDVFLKTRNLRPLLTEPLRQLPGVRLVGDSEMAERGVERSRPEEVVERIEEHDRRAGFDLILLRGRRAARLAAARPRLAGRLWCYLVDVPQKEGEVTEEHLEEIEGIAAASRYLLCQTEDLRSFLEDCVPPARGRTLLLPPMIPPGIEPRPLDEPRQLGRIVYAGKLAPEYGAREMLEIFGRLRERNRDLELHVFGDKIHNPKNDPAFRREIEAALESTPGLVWHRAVTRAELLSRLPAMDLAWSWRLPEMKDSLELSTKVLEYGAAGLPAVLARGEIYEQLLGTGYPLFADGPGEVVSVVEEAAANPDLLATAARSIFAASAGFTFDRVFEEHLARPLGALRRVRGLAARVRSDPPPTLLVAGHDLRFAEPLVRRFECLGVRVLRDRWQGHQQHSEKTSRHLLAEADVVYCEWCLGNAVWYARHRKRDQRLFVRFHRQERETTFPLELPIEAVDQVIFIAEHVRRGELERCGWPEDKTRVIPNAVDAEQFRRPKLPGARHNLGMLGICPRLKRFDRGLDLLETLRAKNPAFKLYVKSKMPWEYPWLWRQEDQREYFDRCFRRIERSPLLGDAVVFEAFGSEVPLWLRKIGYVLSVSDYEGSHQAVAEGLAAGSVPVIVRWPGAGDTYPEAFIHDSTTGAARAVVELSRRDDLGTLRSELCDLAARRFGADAVFERYVRLFFGLGADPAVGDAPPRELGAELEVSRAGQGVG